MIPLLGLLIYRHKKINFKQNLILLFLSIGFVWLILMGIIGGALQDDFSNYWRYFIVLIALVATQQVSRLHWLEWSFLSGLTIAVIGSLISMLSYALQSGDFLLANGAIVNKILWVERPYFGFLLAIDIFILLKNSERQPRWWRLLLAVTFYAFTLYISARLALFLQTFLWAFFIVKTKHLKSSVKLWGGLAASVLITFSLFSNDNFTKRMKLNPDNFNESIAKFIDFEPRFVIWPCAYNIINDQINWGTGLQNESAVDQALTNCYGNSITHNNTKKTYFLNLQFNTHNQFLGVFLYGGILPFIMLITVFILALCSSHSSTETKLIFTLFLMFFLVENVLDRQLGCYLFGIFAGLYQYSTWAKSKSYISSRP